MQSPALVIDNATLAYTPGVPAACGVNVTLPRGKALALIGPNGAGKSTILRGILGLVPVVEGALTVLGGTPAEARGRMGYMPQSDGIDPDFPVTVRQVVGMGLYRRLGWFRWAGRAERAAVSRALDEVGLGAQANHRFGELSGGQRQRAILARAIVAQPEMLLLDEPFNGLDAESRAALIETVKDLKARGVAVVMSTHDLQLAQEACDLVLLVNRDQVACGPTATTLTLDSIERAHPGASVEVDEHSLHLPGHEGH